MSDEELVLRIGDDVSNMKIVEIINHYFGKNYEAWMKAWYDINDDYAAWFPKIYESNERPDGGYGGSQNWSNTLSEDGKSIYVIDHDSIEKPEDNVNNIKGLERQTWEKLRLVFGRINNKFQFLGVFNTNRIWGKEHPTYTHERVATGINLKTFELIGTDIKEKDTVTEWFISGNPTDYDVVGAFNEFNKINWKQVRNYNIGDIIYLYVSEGYQAIKYKCRINKIELQRPEIDDSKFNVSGKYDGKFGRYIELELLNRCEGSGFKRVHLEKLGFKSPQGPYKVTPLLSQYLNMMITLQNKEEMDPDTHDGVYEAMRETVKEYAALSDITNCTVVDVNFLFNLTGIPDSIGVEAKKAKIDSINLTDDAKNRIRELIDRVQNNVLNGQYSNHDDNISFGIFRLPFKAFSSTPDNLARKFLQVCIDVYNEDDEDKCISIVEEAFKDGIQGFQAAAASMILHCIKPKTFPIMNGNEGRDNIFVALAIDVKNPRSLTSYADNCKKIKTFRDNNFSFKNYRILDLESRNLVATSNTNINYLWLMDYLEKNRGVPYEKPDPEKLSADRIAELKDISSKGKAAVNELKKMVALCKEKFGLDIEKGKSIQWRDGSNTKTRDYLWAQMKYEDHAESPESISIFVDMSEVTEQARFRFSLEMRNDGANSQEKANHHRFLELPQDTEHGLVYVAGSNEYGRPELLDMSREEVAQKVNDGTIEKAQICRIIERDPELTNDKCEEIMLEGIGALIPYYEHVLGVQQEEFWPSKEEYDPGITAEKWVELLNDPEVTTQNNLLMFAMMLKYGKPATCTQYAESFGQTKNFFNKGSSALAERVAKKTGCKTPPDRINENARWWPILYVGRDASKEEKGSYVWKIRDELMEALKQIELPELKENTSMSTDSKFGLNTILYGPPGTGKTYSTVKYAVSICDPEYVKAHSEYDDLLKRFNELKADGQVAFTTFHQSYGYEEFIEGIKPIMVSNSESGDSKDVKYDVIPGVFREFCTNASKKKVETRGFNIDEEASIWKVTIKSDVRQDCFDNNHVRIDWDFNTDGAKAFVNDMSAGDIILTTDGSRRRINGIAVVTGDEAYEFDSETDKTARDVKWLAKNIDEDITVINAGKMIHRMTVARVPKMKVEDIVALARRKNQALADTVIEDNTKPYVFIIDEINRGNISKIFGELITLIEETKRAGADEAMEAILPYSGDPFSVPKNVYILGTMNTADRSIALMDTALRRRFDFEEMMPDAEVLRSIGADKVEDLDVALMLEKINERITFLYDREHTIGHAFFTGLKEDPTVEKLASIFSKSVIPLLQEYFYEDYQKIQMVLGDNGKTDDDYKFIKDTDVVAKNIFKGNVEAVIDLPEKRYEINESALYNLESYKEII